LNLTRRIVTTLVTVALSAAGCAGDRANHSDDAASLDKEMAAAAKRDAAAARLAESKQITFINSQVFDNNLSKAMESQVGEIVVEVASRFSLDVLPERVEGWLVHIQQSGGKVEAEARPVQTEVAMRGMPVVEVIELALAYREKAKKKAETKARYAPADTYHAKLYYQKESGTVDRVVFYHR
jgi:hypothetical protein